MRLLDYAQLGLTVLQGRVALRRTQQGQGITHLEAVLLTCPACLGPSQVVQAKLLALLAQRGTTAKTPPPPHLLSVPPATTVLRAPSSLGHVHLVPSTQTQQQEPPVQVTAQRVQEAITAKLQDSVQSQASVVLGITAPQEHCTSSLSLK